MQETFIPPTKVRPAASAGRPHCWTCGGGGLNVPQPPPVIEAGGGDVSDAGGVKPHDPSDGRILRCLTAIHCPGPKR